MKIQLKVEADYELMVEVASAAEQDVQEEQQDEAVEGAWAPRSEKRLSAGYQVELHCAWKLAVREFLLGLGLVSLEVQVHLTV